MDLAAARRLDIYGAESFSFACMYVVAGNCLQSVAFNAAQRRAALGGRKAASTLPYVERGREGCNC